MDKSSVSSLYILYRKAYIYYVISRKEACKRKFITIEEIQYYDRILNIQRKF
jgi:hypothetical protein